MNKVTSDSLDQTFALYFSDYEEADHKRVTTDGVQTLVITDLEAYNARIASEQAQEQIEENARIAELEWRNNFEEAQI